MTGTRKPAESVATPALYRSRVRKDVRLTANFGHSGRGPESAEVGAQPMLLWLDWYSRGLWLMRRPAGG
jgi:hypothetical protein